MTAWLYPAAGYALTASFWGGYLWWSRPRAGDST